MKYFFGNLLLELPDECNPKFTGLGATLRRMTLFLKRSPLPPFQLGNSWTLSMDGVEIIACRQPTTNPKGFLKEFLESCANSAIEIQSGSVNGIDYSYNHSESKNTRWSGLIYCIHGKNHAYCFSIEAQEIPPSARQKLVEIIQSASCPPPQYMNPQANQ